MILKSAALTSWTVIVTVSPVIFEKHLSIELNEIWEAKTWSPSISPSVFGVIVICWLIFQFTGVKVIEVGEKSASDISGLEKLTVTSAKGGLSRAIWKVVGESVSAMVISLSDNVNVLGGNILRVPHQSWLGYIEKLG